MGRNGRNGLGIHQDFTNEPGMNQESTRNGGGVESSAPGGSFVINVVDVQDRPLLLDMDLNGLQSSIKCYSWVRIKRGIHKGDLALVRDVDKHSLMCKIYVIPRLAYNGKRK